jgi:Family of unknown function (DUF6082)
MTIAVISTLISSIALVAVAASLLIQARQLRASQLQAARTAQFDFMKMQFDNPELASVVFGNQFRAEVSLMNWYVKYMELSYLLKTISKESIIIQAALLFSGKYAREWWNLARDVYKAEAAGRLEREFFAILDGAYEKAVQGGASIADPTTGGEEASTATG